MSKDTNTPQSPSLPTHPSMPCVMGFPFPVFNPHMGQFVPMGMVPMNSQAIQHYLETMSKGGLHPAFASMFGTPPFGPMSMTSNKNQASCPGNIGDQANMLGSRFELPEKNFRDDIDDARTMTSFHSKGEGATGPQRVVPPIVFLPFGSFTGYFPNYPQFNPLVTYTNDGTALKDSDNQPSRHQGMGLESKSSDDKDLDELDVAQILVDMHVPVLNKVKNHGVTSNLIAEEKQNLISKEDTCVAKDSYCGTKEDVSDLKVLHQEDIPISDNSKQRERNIESKSHDESTITKRVNKISKEVTEVVFQSEKSCNKNSEETSNLIIGVKHEWESTETGHCQSSTRNPKESFQTERESEHVKVEHLKAGHVENEKIMEVCCDQNLVEKVIPESEDSSSTLTVLRSVPSGQSIVEMDCEDKTLIVFSPKEKEDQTHVEECHVESEITIELEPSEELSGDENGGPNTYKCAVCSQLFRSPLGLQKHIEFHTEDGKQYTCTICFLHFSNHFALQDHLETHLRKRPHKCSFCPKAFRDPGSLQKHVRVHTGEKPYKCKDCYRSFAEYSSLRKHQRVHTGEQPYTCQYCDKAFSISGNLQRHILIHTGERPYKCSFCPKAFNNPSHLRRHVKNLHFKGDLAIDEAMLSHYGNPSSFKLNENEVVGGSNGEILKQDVVENEQKETSVS